MASNDDLKSMERYVLEGEENPALMEKTYQLYEVTYETEYHLLVSIKEAGQLPATQALAGRIEEPVVYDYWNN